MTNEKAPLVLLENQVALLAGLLNEIMHEGMSDIELDQITDPESPELWEIRVTLHDVAGDETVWAIGAFDEQVRKVKRSVSASVGE